MAQPPATTTVTAPTQPSQTLYVSNLNDTVKPSDVTTLLHTLFSRHGSVLDVVVVKRRDMRGQAHVVMFDIASASRALRALHGVTLLGKPLRVTYAKSKSYAVARLDGTYTPYVSDGMLEGEVETNGVKRKRDADVESDDEDG